MTLLTSFGPEIWLSDGPLVEGAMGFHFPTRMAVIRLAQGSLFIWSPVALTAELRRALSELGPVAQIVAPNTLHHTFLGDWQTAFPQARFYSAPGLAAKRPDIRFDDELGDAAAEPWADEIDQVVFRGNSIATEVVFFHCASRTAIFTDLLQQMPRGLFRGWRGLVARLDLMTGDAPEVPRKFRMAFRDKQATRVTVDRVLEWPAERLVVAHGAPVQAGGQAAIRRAFRWLR